MTLVILSLALVGAVVSLAASALAVALYPRD